MSLGCWNACQKLHDLLAWQLSKQCLNGCDCCFLCCTECRLLAPAACTGICTRHTACNLVLAQLLLRILRC